MKRLFATGLLLIISVAVGCVGRQITAAQPTSRPVEQVHHEVMNPGMVWISPDELDPDFRAEGEPFRKVIERLGDAVLAVIKFDEDALKAAGVRMDVAVSVLAKKATTASALKAILANVSERTAGKPALGYTLGGNNMVLITTRADLLAKHVYTREYAVHDLLLDPDDARRAETFVQLVKDVVDPTSWDFAGSKCVARTSKGVLTVTQTNENLKAVETLLEQLRETRGPEPLERRLHWGGRWEKAKE